MLLLSPALDPFLLLKIYAQAGLKGQIEIADIFIVPFSAFNFGSSSSAQLLHCLFNFDKFCFKENFWNENVVA